jgi:hypothetical protein
VKSRGNTTGKTTKGTTMGGSSAKTNAMKGLSVTSASQWLY